MTKHLPVMLTTLAAAAAVVVAVMQYSVLLLLSLHLEELRTNMFYFYILGHAQKDGTNLFSVFFVSTTHAQS